METILELFPQAGAAHQACATHPAGAAPRPPEFNVEHRRAHRASALVMKVAILFPFSQTPLHQRKWPTAKPNRLPNIDRGGARGGAPVH